MKDRIAILDLGTNTYNLLVAEWENGLKVVHKAKIPVMMGKSGLKNGLDEAAMQRAVSAVDALVDEAKNFKVNKILTYATSAIRSANNGHELVKLIKISCGIEVNVIGGIEEASLIYNGVKCSGIESKNCLIMDIGGGSTEFILVKNNKIIYTESFDHGVARLKEKFSFSDPCTQEELGEILNFLSEEWGELIQLIGEDSFDFIGCSGSFETALEIVAHEKNEVIEEGWVYQEIQKEEWNSIHQFLLFSTTHDREEHPAIIPLRVEYMVYASVLMDLGLSISNSKRIKICDYALKEGAAFRYFESL